MRKPPSSSRGRFTFDLDIPEHRQPVPFCLRTYDAYSIVISRALAQMT
jgi:hypothetical protein